MRIGVEVSAVGDLLQVGVRKLFGQDAEVIVDTADRWNVADLHAADALGSEHPVRRVGVDYARNQDVRKSRQRLSELRRITRLGAVIELVGERALDLLYDTDQIDARPRRGVLRQKSCQLTEVLEVFGELLTQVWPLNLDDDVASIAQYRGVNLAEARAAQRLRLEGLEELGHPRVQLLLDSFLDVVERHRRNIVL